jgi:high-affinity iron transporter
MIGAALIVLREVFEAALLIGILLAGTRDLAGRGRWVAGGVALGLLGAVIVALGAGRLADAFEGSGQEVFNATVLLAATALLGWHSLWMKRHGRELAAQLAGVGRRIASGVTPLSGLLLVVALAVLREGAELVLFLYGIAAGGADAHALATGSLIGLVGGVAIGAVVYRGLAVIPPRHLFAVTGTLLLLLAAGLASQAASNLVQAGWLPPLVDPVWNSAWLVSEHGAVGQALHALLGYVERPSATQLLAFALALGVLAGVGRLGAGPIPQDSRPHGRPLAVALAIALAAILPGRAQAGLVIYSPVVEAGEAAVELRSQRDLDGRAAANGAEDHKVELEYAPNDRWLAEGLITIERDPGGARHVTEASFENVFALAPQGKYAADFGLLAEYAHGIGTDSHDAIELGLLAEKSFARTVLTVNLTAEQALTSGSRADLGYAARLRWRRHAHFEPGIELHGELGRVDALGRLGAHRHQMGPSAMGRFRLGAHRAVRYEAAWVFGLTSASPDSTARLKFEYEF